MTGIADKIASIETAAAACAASSLTYAQAAAVIKMALLQPVVIAGKTCASFTLSSGTTINLGLSEARELLKTFHELARIYDAGDDQHLQVLEAWS